MPLNLRPTIPLLPPRSSSYISFILHSCCSSCLFRLPSWQPCLLKSIVSLLFSIMKANYATENHETRASFQNERYKRSFPRSNKHVVRISMLENGSFAFEEAEQRYGVVPDGQVISTIAERIGKVSERWNWSDETREKYANHNEYDLWSVRICVVGNTRETRSPFSRPLLRRFAYWFGDTRRFWEAKPPWGPAAFEW